MKKSVFLNEYISVLKTYSSSIKKADSHEPAF